MRRKLSIIALVLTAGFVSACANPAGPSRDGLEGCKRIVTVGTQTRCADDEK